MLAFLLHPSELQGSDTCLEETLPGAPVLARFQKSMVSVVLYVSPQPSPPILLGLSFNNKKRLEWDLICL